MTLLLGKLVVSVVVVLSLAWVAEHVNSRVAGIVSGMPLGAVLVLSFVGTDLGQDFAAQTALFAVPSIVATLSFANGYAFASRWGGRLSPLVASMVGLGCYFVVASALSAVDFSLLGGLGLTLATLVAVAWAVHSFETGKIQKRVRMTFRRLLFRAGTASGMVVVIASFAELIGPRWSGLLIGFPMTFLPFLLIIHVNYSAEQVRTIVRNFPMGLIGLLTFLVIATLAIPLYGVGLGILAGLGASLVYLSLLGAILTWLKPAGASA